MLKIWYTVNVCSLANAHAAEVVRHWSHPLTYGSLPVWANLFKTEQEARCEAQQEAIRIENEQAKRNAACACVTLGAFDYVE
jgi:hypothetical protein